VSRLAPSAAYLVSVLSPPVSSHYGQWNSTHSPGCLLQKYRSIDYPLITPDVSPCAKYFCA